MHFCSFSLFHLFNYPFHATFLCTIFKVCNFFHVQLSSSLSENDCRLVRLSVQNEAFREIDHIACAIFPIHFLNLTSSFRLHRRSTSPPLPISLHFYSSSPISMPSSCNVHYHQHNRPFEESLSLSSIMHAIAAKLPQPIGCFGQRSGRPRWALNQNAFVGGAFVKGGRGRRDLLLPHHVDRHGGDRLTDCVHESVRRGAGA